MNTKFCWGRILTLWQVVGGSMPVERQTLTDGIRGWEQKDAQWEGGAFTGNLAQGPHIHWRWPRSPSDQPLQLKASTEPHNSYNSLTTLLAFSTNTDNIKCSVKTFHRQGQWSTQAFYMSIHLILSLSATLGWLLLNRYQAKSITSQTLLNGRNDATVPHRSLTYWVWSSLDSRIVIMQHLQSFAK